MFACKINKRNLLRKTLNIAFCWIRRRILQLGQFSPPRGKIRFFNNFYYFFFFLSSASLTLKRFTSRTPRRTDRELKTKMLSRSRISVRNARTMLVDTRVSPLLEPLLGLHGFRNTIITRRPQWFSPVDYNEIYHRAYVSYGFFFFFFFGFRWAEPHWFHNDAGGGEVFVSENSKRTEWCSVFYDHSRFPVTNWYFFFFSAGKKARKNYIKPQFRQIPLYRRYFFIFFFFSLILKLMKPDIFTNNKQKKKIHLLLYNFIENIIIFFFF